ncbi:TatD family nuclease-associated radical SAM protein [Thiohalophilus sp.]|uniref:TatD family nuclease-associated radical SAM protein n=1 Tax=Thiohalophilus sp. TaxID=3028392 RepID=UPI003976E0BD
MQSTKQVMEQPPTVAYRLHGNCYLNTTWHCTLRCRFCPKFNGSREVQGYNLWLQSEPDTDQILAAVGDPADYNEIVFCGYGEPTLRLEVLLQVAGALKQQGARIRVNTDGLANLVHGYDVTSRLVQVVDAVSISLNAHEERLYDYHCRPKRHGAFRALQNFARCASQHGMAVTLTAIDGLEEVSIPACEKIASELGMQFRARQLNQVG